MYVYYDYNYSQGIDDPLRDIRGLMLCDTPSKHHRTLHVDEVEMEFSLANKETNVSLHTFIHYLSLTRPAGRLWLLHGFGELQV